MSKLSATGRNPEAVTIQSVRKIQGPDLDAQHWLQEQQRNKAQLPGGFRNFLALNVKELEVLLMCNKPYCADCSQRLLQEPQSHRGKSSPAGPQSQQSQATQQRK
ncbi:Hypothetical predicted protein [Lynx pardinus]|uniref:Uncharacterized protein n=1 Tax=Lynx pardinus TaxID=191816 RepID=A0A485MAH5_LYNPA|nr:Hypothetical predicted protein [Lynx pardinus]